MMNRVLIADDHGIVREGLRGLLARRSDVEVVGEAENGSEAVRMVQELSPDIVIMDVSMPDMNGIDATRQIRQKHGNTHIIALSVHSDRRFVIQMFQAGARGYLLKDCVFDELARAIAAVSRGQTYLSPQIQGVVTDLISSPNPGASPTQAAPALTPREREVLQLIAEGHSTKSIAGRLKLSVKTIESHRANIQEKTGLHSVAELTKFAIREGLTSLH